MIINFKDNDPFSDNFNNNNQKIHLRCQARNGRKCISTVQGLPTDINLKKIIKTFKKNFSCNGAIRNDSDMGNIIQLSGDQRANVRDFLVKHNISTRNDIIIHGISIYKYDSENNSSADVNIFITSITTSAVQFESSAPFTGKVHFHIYSQD